MLQLTDVVKNLLIINGLMFLAFNLMGLMPVGAMALYYPSSTPPFYPYQLVTHMFMHANGSHLLFNMIGIIFFGPALEMLLGPKRFLTLYFVAGFGAMLLHLGVSYMELHVLHIVPHAVIGASGALFGLMVGFAMKFPHNTISLMFPPVSINARMFVLGYAALELFLGMGRFDTGIAHFAHLGGALFGYLLLSYWDKKSNNFRQW